MPFPRDRQFCEPMLHSSDAQTPVQTLFSNLKDSGFSCATHLLPYSMQCSNPLTLFIRTFTVHPVFFSNGMQSQVLAFGTEHYNDLVRRTLVAFWEEGSCRLGWNWYPCMKITCL